MSLGCGTLRVVGSIQEGRQCLLLQYEGRGSLLV